jgi:hypothetical protein
VNAIIEKLLTELTTDIIKLIPAIIRSIRDGNHKQAAELARRAALAQAAKKAIR